MKFPIGMIVCGIGLLFLGILMIPSIDLGPTDNLQDFIYDRHISEIITKDQPMIHTLWLFENEPITGSIYAKDSQHKIDVKIESLEQELIFEGNLINYLWIDFNTNNPPGQYIITVSQNSEQEQHVKLSLNMPSKIDPVSQDILQEKIRVPKLVKYTLGPIVDVIGGLIIGIGTFLFIQNKNDKLWNKFKLLLIGGLIIGIGMIISNDSMSIMSGLDYSDKESIPQDGNFSSSFLTGWADYIFLLILPMLIISIGIIWSVIAGIKFLIKLKTKSTDDELK